MSGVIARAEAIVQQRRGPRVLQPYFDILKLLRKETVLPAPLDRRELDAIFAGGVGLPRRHSAG